VDKVDDEYAPARAYASDTEPAGTPELVTASGAGIPVAGRAPVWPTPPGGDETTERKGS
jgi:hypothetical protein